MHDLVFRSKHVRATRDRKRWIRDRERHEKHPSSDIAELGALLSALGGASLPAFGVSIQPPCGTDGEPTLQLGSILADTSFVNRKFII